MRISFFRPTVFKVIFSGFFLVSALTIFICRYFSLCYTNFNFVILPFLVPGWFVVSVFSILLEELGIISVACFLGCEPHTVFGYVLVFVLTLVVFYVVACLLALLGRRIKRFQKKET